MTRNELKQHALVHARLHSLSMAALARDIGISKQRLNNFLTGKSNSVRLAIRVCKALGLPNEVAYKTCRLE